MRADLRFLQAAGLTRMRFSARVQKVDSRGFIALRNVYSPVGLTHHVWVKPEQWHGRQPRPGQRVEFTATIQSYWKGDGEEDLCLIGLELV